jgi:hypothetical protein
VHVTETFDGKPVWEGEVSVFDVDHPDADTAYVWSAYIEETDKWKVFVILGKPPINSPQDAVKAGIASLAP